MTKDDLIQMADLAGYDVDEDEVYAPASGRYGLDPRLEHFAKLVAGYALRYECRDVSTKLQNSDTSAKHVHEIDKSIHDLRKAAEVALDALEDSMYPQKKQFDAIVGLNRALAQPEPAVEPTNSATNLVESKHLAQTVQAPIAYLCENATGHKYFRWKKPTSHYKPIALYTAPLKLKWVGLENIDFQYQPPAEVITMKYAEAILKEKNK